MDLWSRGLGKRVLSLSLAESSSMETRDGALVIEGVMRAPTYWDYAVTLDEEDLVEFVGLLRRRETLRFLAADGRRLPFLRTAFPAAAVFALRTLRLLVRGLPSEESEAPGDDASAAGETDGETADAGA